MTIEEIGIIASLFLTFIGWSTTAYFQRKILDRQIQAEKDKLVQQFSHDKEMLALEYQQKILERRLTVYPKLVELIYRTRNLSREICNNSESPFIIFDELIARMQELEELVYSNKIDLEQDNIFDSTHDYKNLVSTITRLSKDLRFFIENSAADHEEAVRLEMREIYEKIEVLHKPTINNLVRHTSTITNDIKQ